MSHLDDQITSMRADVAEVRRLLAEEELNVKRKDRELAQQQDRIEELAKVGGCIAASKLFLVV